MHETLWNEINLNVGIGWMPAIDQYLQIVAEIEKYNGITGSIHSMQRKKGKLEIDQCLPVDEVEEAILEKCIKRWTSKLCNVCGRPGEMFNELVRCDHHKRVGYELCSVKGVGEYEGMPTFQDGALVVSRTSSQNQFSLIFYRYPERIHPPETHGQCILQMPTEWDILCDKNEGRARIEEAKLQGNIDLIFMDRDSYLMLVTPDAFYTPTGINPSEYPELNKLFQYLDEDEQITRDEAKRAYWRNWRGVDKDEIPEEEKELIHSLFCGSDPDENTPYLTGVAALSVIPPDRHYPLMRPGRYLNQIAGVDLRSTWHLLGYDGIYDNPSYLRRHGVILPHPLVATHERAIFDLLYHFIDTKDGRLPSFELYDTEFLDASVIAEWISDSRLPGAKKYGMISELGRLTGEDW